MATLKFPRSEFAVLRRFSLLDEPSMAAIIKAAEEIPAELAPVAFAEHMAEKISTIPNDDLKSFLKLFFGLYGAKDRSKKSAKQIAADVAETIIEEKIKDFPPQQIKLVEDRIARILSIGGSFVTTAKAGSLMRDYPCICTEVKIISDIRPIFGESADEISGVIMVHNLKISYWENGEHKQFYFAMDNADIKSLKEAVDRVGIKAKSLASMIQKSGVKHLEEGK
jgi:hypothetical protein